MNTQSGVVCALWACADDGAGGVLTHMYGQNLTKPRIMDGSGYSRDSECNLLAAHSSMELRSVPEWRAHVAACYRPHLHALAAIQVSY